MPVSESRPQAPAQPAGDASAPPRPAGSSTARPWGRLLASGLLAAGFVGLAVRTGGNGAHLWGPGIGLPGGFFLVSLVEVVSGVPFSTWESRYAQLSPTGRLLASLGILALALPPVFALAILIGWLASLPR